MTYDQKSFFEELLSSDAWSHVIAKSETPVRKCISTWKKVISLSLPRIKIGILNSWLRRSLTAASSADVAVDYGAGSRVRVLDERVGDPGGQVSIRSALQ